MTDRVFFLIIIVFLLLVIFMSLGKSCCRVSPYSNNSLYPKLYKFEGFEPLAFSPYMADEEAHDSKNTQEQHPNINMEENKEDDSQIPVEGFRGLQSSPNNSQQNVIDIFSQARGSRDCKDSFGYTNNEGNLCLDEKQRYMLKTRGGNASGREMEIGY
jgi:hypothetical protein